MEPRQNSRLCRSNSEVSRFEIQSHLYQQLLSLGYEARGGIAVPIGKGFKHVDIAVMVDGFPIHIVMVSGSADAESPRVKEKRNRQSKRRADVMASLGCSVTIVDSLKSASDFISFVRKHKGFPVNPSVENSVVNLGDMRTRSQKQAVRSGAKGKENRQHREPRSIDKEFRSIASN